MNFTSLETMHGTRWLQAIGETVARNSQLAQRVAVSFGPDYAPLEQRQVELALMEAQRHSPAPDILVFAAFQFDLEASKDIELTTSAGITMLRTQMNPDLLTGDLQKNKASTDSFWLIGQPDVALEEADNGVSGDWIVRVNGFDYFNPTTNTIITGGRDDIALWMLDTDYNGRCLFPRQVFSRKGTKSTAGGGSPKRSVPIWMWTALRHLRVRAHSRFAQATISRSLSRSLIPAGWRASRSWTSPKRADICGSSLCLPRQIHQKGERPQRSRN